MNLASESMLRLPSIQRFAASVREALDERHVLLGLGKGMDGACARAMALECLGKVHHQEVLTTQREPTESPAQMLGRVMDCAASNFIPGSSNRDDCPGVPSVVLLSEIDSLSETERHGWLEYLSEVARLNWAAPSRLFMATQSPAGLDSDSRLAVFQFQSELSRLDISLLCREAGGDGDEAEDAWREAVLPEICGGDVTLFEPLWSPVLTTMADLLRALEKEARARSWDARLRPLVSAARKYPREAALRSVSHRWRPLWDAGLAHGLRAVGMELSPVALVWTGEEEDRREVVHRYWRGQARLILPLVDEIRLRTCEAMNESHGRGWATRFLEFNDAADEDRARQDPFSVDYGALKRIVSQHSAKADRFREAVSLGWYVRNELAHYRPVSFSQFKELRSLERATW